LGARRGAVGGGSTGFRTLCGGDTCSSCDSAGGPSSTGGVRRGAARRGGVASRPAWSSRALFTLLGTSTLDCTVGGGRSVETGGRSRSGSAGVVRRDPRDGRSGSAGGRLRSSSAGVVRRDPCSERWDGRSGSAVGRSRSGSAGVARCESRPNAAAGVGRRVDVDRRSSSESSVETNSLLRTLLELGRSVVELVRATVDVEPIRAVVELVRAVVEPEALWGPATFHPRARAISSAVAKGPIEPKSVV